MTGTDPSPGTAFLFLRGGFGGLPTVEQRAGAHRVFSSPLPPRRVTRLTSEKRELEAQLGRSREEALAGRAARQEAESLRGLVRGLELELRQERGLGGRAAGRRSQDSRRLAKEVRGGCGEGAPQWTSSACSGPQRSLFPSAARGGEGIGAQSACKAQDTEQRAGHVQKGVRGVAYGVGQKEGWSEKLALGGGRGLWRIW